MNDPAKPVTKWTPSERVAALEERLGRAVGSLGHALAALTHKSYCNEHRDEPCTDNERLEFLGDAVVDLAVGQRLYERFPKAAEGELSKLRALIVNTDGLASTARTLRLGELLLLGRGEELTGGREKPSVLADALEAVIGALYLTHGMEAVLDFVDTAFRDALDGVAEGRQGKDYKTLLQEDAQGRLKAVPRYRVVSEQGPDHEKVFEVEVSIGAQTYARSSGRSKKEAEQAAARVTLDLLSKPPEP